MAQRIANQNRMLSSVNVTFSITLTIKRSIRKPTMTETAVTTCGVTIFEISQMTPITMESRIASSMKRVQPKRRTCLKEIGCRLMLLLLFDASALIKAGSQHKINARPKKLGFRTSSEEFFLYLQTYLHFEVKSTL